MSITLLPGGKGEDGERGRPGDKRLFFGLAIPAPVKAEIVKLSASFGMAPPLVRWVRGENLHITVKFLGNVSPEAVDDLVSVGKDVAASLSPFALRAEGVGLYPNHESPRIVYIDVGGGVQSALHLERALVTALEPLRFPPEQRHYTPHITIGRVRNNQARGKLVRLVRKYQHHFVGPVTVNELVLYESALHRTGPVHTHHATFPLGGS